MSFTMMFQCIWVLYQNQPLDPYGITISVSQICSEEGGKIFTNRTATWKYYSMKAIMQGTLRLRGQLQNWLQLGPEDQRRRERSSELVLTHTASQTCLYRHLSIHFQPLYPTWERKGQKTMEGDIGTAIRIKSECLQTLLMLFRRFSISPLLAFEKLISWLPLWPLP